MPNIFKNPYVNGVYAEVYIVAVASVIRYFGSLNVPDNFLDPIAVLSLFVLSAALMGYLFLGEPLQLYLGGEKKQAISFFVRTVTGFAIITLVVLAAVVLVR